MKGWHIFFHSLQQVTGNLAGAIRVSALPYLIQFVVMVLVMGFGANAFDAEAMVAAGGPDGDFFLKLAVFFVIALFTSLWIAVGWHRYVLLGEEPAGYMPTMKPDRIWAYFVRSMGVVLVLFAASIPFSILGGLISVALGAVPGGTMFMIVMAAVVYVPLVILSFRLSGSLPATALGSEVDFWAGWNATKSANVDMLVLAIIGVVASLAINALGMIPVIGIAVQFVGGWVMMMVGVSILTTIYGHYIEGRNIAGIREEPNPFE
jgi:hypothetical protein